VAARRTIRTGRAIRHATIHWRLFAGRECSKHLPRKLDRSTGHSQDNPHTHNHPPDAETGRPKPFVNVSVTLLARQEVVDMRVARSLLGIVILLPAAHRPQPA
jgi:hypothetical protein